MSLRGKYIISGVALLVPMSLIVGRALIAGDARLLEPATALLNWLYMAAPQLLALAVAAFHTPSRQHFLVPALVAGGLLLVAFQAWVWFFVPPRESGLAWILYFPLWAILLAVMAIAIALQRKAKSEL